MRAAIAAVVTALLAAGTARADSIPAPVEAILDAISNDSELLHKVAEVAKRTNPESVPEINAKLAGIKKAAADAREAKLASQTLMEGWTGSGEVGAFASSGNTQNSGVALGGRLTKQSRKWKHTARGAIDYQRERGRTSKERYFAGYEGNYSMSPRSYMLVTASYERDRFSGFNHRFAESVGFGYKFIDAPALKLSLEGGPALRQTRFTNGVDDIGVAVRSAGNIRWDATPKVAITQNTSFYYDSFNTSLQSLAAATAKLNGALSARASFQLNTESNPPVGRQTSDTTSRLTLVYSF